MLGIGFRVVKEVWGVKLEKTKGLEADWKLRE